ncbi:hypothetical protein STIUS_v1c01750 [Spiroplasma sp. TIUS-1]|uniref:MepB family protein n=1 Tax=Spiroplasma sp. TIUS-1 TaxID=216963 RepID=UPI001397A355|nr:MepB family protein [Spiroplasma sp. TIUS-1]QHX35730.1 hypothetical protein STIUS_v1c01750 [Spiroplasma sp. TIUS-1]
MNYKILDNDFNLKYDGKIVEYNTKYYRYRKARKTNKKEGYFVAFWEKENKINVPFNSKMDYDGFIIYIKDKKLEGFFVFSKDFLVENGYLKSEKFNGKMGFRVYPIQTDTMNETAIKTYNTTKSFFKII